MVGSKRQIPMFEKKMKHTGRLVSFFVRDDPPWRLSDLRTYTIHTVSSNEPHMFFFRIFVFFLNFLLVEQLFCRLGRFR